MKSFLPLACALLVACAPARCAEKPSGQEPGISQPANGALTADTPLTTADGNSFVAPADWSVRRAGAAVILTAPEGGSHIAIVDVEAKDADAAVMAAWAAYDPGAERILNLASDRPARDGWVQIRSYQYETSAADKRSVSARALKRGDGWTVTIYDMANAVGEKRDAQVELILGRLLPKGYRRESFAGKTAHKLDAARIDALEQFVENARQQFGVPGVAIGIVQDGNVAYAEGFGIRELGKPEKVDADTRFMIASNTKALTTLMLAKLVDAGKFSWDTPVTQVLPTFRLGNADTTRQVMMKHLVCACTGLPRQDMEWMFASEGASPDSVMATVATMQPTSEFGELYQYSNLLAAAAGFIGGHAVHPQKELGAAYDAAMQSLVFDPLGMTSTTLDFARAQRGNHAAPHGQDVDGKTVPASMDLNYADIPNRPNGGVWSNVNDLLRYVQMELDKGRLPDGTRYIGEAPLLARREQQVARGSDTGYGMGLKLDRSMGTLLVNHGGSAFGFISDMLWLPEHNVGAVILTNDDAGGVYVRSLFRRRLLEVLFDGRPEAVDGAAVQARRMKENIAAKREFLTVPADPVLVGKLAERYRSSELGGIDVLRKGAATWFDFGDWKSEVASRRNGDDTVSFVTISPSESGYEFTVAVTENERSLVLRDAQHEYVFAETK